MKAYIVCLPQGGGCVVKLAPNRDKARMAGASEMGVSFYDFREVLECRAIRIPDYDGDDEWAAHKAYYRDHDDETGEPYELPGGRQA